MKLRQRMCAAGLLLGVAAALLQGDGSILLLSVRPWTALGAFLRSWSLSGVAGNLGAWSVVLILTALPTVCILILRRKRRQKSDVLWLLVSVTIFPTLFLLINPTYLSLARVGLSADLAVMTMVLTMLSLLSAALLTRWAGGLKDARLTFWLNALISLAMALISLSAGWTATESLLRLGSTGEESIPLLSGVSAALAPAPGTAFGSLLIALISLIPDAFTLHALHAAAQLAETMEKGWFSVETEAQATRLARCARRVLVASICCAAGKNALSLLIGWLQGASVGLSVSLALPLTEMLLSCGAMLLARWLAAACKLKRDNDLMI